MFETYVVTVIVAFLLDILDRIVRKNKYTDGFSLLMSAVISFTPIINLVFSFISIQEIYKHSSRNKKEKNKILRKYNKFMECNSCQVIVRNGYIIENESNKCPICEHIGHKEISNKDYIANTKIPEQLYISDIESFRKNKLQLKSDEQEQLYFKALEEKLKKS